MVPFTEPTFLSIWSRRPPDGLSLGLGWTPRQALMRSLEPFDGLIEDLLTTAPQEFLEHGAIG